MEQCFIFCVETAKNMWSGSLIVIKTLSSATF